MQPFTRQNKAAKWARFALKCGLLLTDAKLWSSISSQLRERADDMGDEAKRRYDDTVDRVRDAHDALHGHSHWVSPAVSFLGGVGLGVGLSIILTPVSGEEARSALRNKVVDMKNKVSDIATGARSRIEPSITTGTRGD